MRPDSLLEVMSVDYCVGVNRLSSLMRMKVITASTNMMRLTANWP